MRLFNFKEYRLYCAMFGLKPCMYKSLKEFKLVCEIIDEVEGL